MDPNTAKERIEREEKYYFGLILEYLSGLEEVLVVEHLSKLKEQVRRLGKNADFLAQIA